MLPAGVGRLRVEGIDIAGQKLTVDVDADRCEISGAGPLSDQHGALPALRPLRGPTRRRPTWPGASEVVTFGPWASGAVAGH